MEQRHTTMEEAEAQLYRRIQELRAQARGSTAEAADEAAPTEQQRPTMPDLRTILARAESHVDELRSTAATLEESLPARVERAVERAIAGQQGDPRQHEELRELMRSLARQIEQVNRDLLAERLGRVEDLELVVDLVSTGMAALRQDVATLSAHVEQIGSGMDDVAMKLDQPLQVTVERPPRKGVRDLFTRTDEPPAAS
jgi:chromosome segregation ATPase